MIRRPPRSTRTDTLLPDTTLFRSLKSAKIPVALCNKLFCLTRGHHVRFSFKAASAVSQPKRSADTKLPPALGREVVDIAPRQRRFVVSMYPDIHPARKSVGTGQSV